MGSRISLLVSRVRVIDGSTCISESLIVLACIIFGPALGSSPIWRRVVVYVLISIIKAGKVTGVFGSETTVVDSSEGSEHCLRANV